MYHKWTKEEESKLAELYKEYTCKEIYEKFFPNLRLFQISNKLQRLKLDKSVGYIWSKEEDKLLKELYKTKSTTYLSNNEFSHLTQAQIEKRAAKIGAKVEHRRKWTFDYNFFKNINNTSAYWAGFIAGDGCITDIKTGTSLKILLSRVDSKHLIKFKKDIKYTGPIVYREDNGNQNARISLNCVKDNLAKDLHEIYDIGPRKSLTYSFPKNLPKEFYFPFIKGLIDADGWMVLRERKQRNSLIFKLGFCGTEDCVRWVYNICRDKFDLNDRKLISQTRNDFSLFRFELSYIQAFKLATGLKQYKTPELTRKWKALDEYISFRKQKGLQCQL